jgi:Xaa-Pro aminopeptidase
MLSASALAPVLTSFAHSHRPGSSNLVNYNALAMSELIERRRKALWQKVRDQGLDAFLLVNVEGSEQPNVRYLTGFTGTFSILVVTEESLFFTDPRYTEQAQNRGGFAGGGGPRPLGSPGDRAP